MSCNELSSKSGSNLVIQRSGVDYITLIDGQVNFNQPTNISIDDTNYVKKTGETLQVIDGATVIGGGVRYETNTLTVNGPAYVNGNFYITPNTYIANSGAPSGGRQTNFIVLGNATTSLFQIFLGNSNNLRVQVAWNDTYFRNNIQSEGTVKSDNYDTRFDSEMLFKRSGTNVMKFNTSNQLQFLQGAEKSFIYEEEFIDVQTFNVFRIRNTENSNPAYISFGVGDVLDVLQISKTLITSAVNMTVPAITCSTFDSSGNVVFRKDGTDYLYLRNGYVEVNSSSSLWSSTVRTNTINTTGGDMVFQRNGVEFFRLGTGYSTAGGAPADIVAFPGTTVGISASWMFSNAFANRSVDTNTDFLGAVSAGSAWGKLYMKYEYATENLHIYTDVEIDQGKKLYIHKEASKNSFISSINIAGVNHTNFQNEDPNGDLRFFANGGVRLFITPSKVSVPAPYTIEGDLVDTSDLAKKYDIKNVEHNFTDIVKQIEPKTFKMNDEKK